MNWKLGLSRGLYWGKKRVLLGLYGGKNGTM